MKPIVWIAGFLLLQAFLLGGSGAQNPVGQSSGRLSLQTPSGPEEAIRLLGQLWDSGFFQHCESVRDEFLNNDYALFEPGSPLAVLEKRGMACYSRGPGRKDTIFLRRDSFAHFKVGLEGVFERGSVNATVLKVLVHELCHDLWASLLDERERAYFAMDGEDFIGDCRLAITTEDKRGFLLKEGQKVKNAALSRFFADLEVLIVTYPPDILHGPELFAWLGERAFSTGMEIPLVFRKYFIGIITAATPRPGVPLF